MALFKKGIYPMTLDMSLKEVGKRTSASASKQQRTINALLIKQHRKFIILLRNWSILHSKQRNPDHLLLYKISFKNYRFINSSGKFSAITIHSSLLKKGTKKSDVWHSRFLYRSIFRDQKKCGMFFAVASYSLNDIRYWTS